MRRKKWLERMRDPLWTRTQELNLQARELKASLPWPNPIRLLWYWWLTFWDWLCW